MIEIQLRTYGSPQPSLTVFCAFGLSGCARIQEPKGEEARRLRAVQRLLGHASATMTLDTYSHT